MGGPLKSPKRGGVERWSLFSLLSVIHFSFFISPSIPLHLGLSPNEKSPPSSFPFSLFPTLRLHIRAVAFMRRFQHQRWSFFITKGSVHISNDWE